MVAGQPNLELSHNYLMFFTVAAITGGVTLKIFIHFWLVVGVSHAGIFVVILGRVCP